MCLAREGYALKAASQEPLFWAGDFNSNSGKHVIILLKYLFERRNLLELFFRWLRNCVLIDDCLLLRYAVWELSLGKTRKLMPHQPHPTPHPRQHPGVGKGVNRLIYKWPVSVKINCMYWRVNVSLDILYPEAVGFAWLQDLGMWQWYLDRASCLICPRWAFLLVSALSTLLCLRYPVIKHCGQISWLFSCRTGSLESRVV